MAWGGVYTCEYGPELDRRGSRTLTPWGAVFRCGYTPTPVHASKWSDMLTAVARGAEADVVHGGSGHSLRSGTMVSQRQNV
eukprot:2071907-Amphidinium_carterae.2